MKNVIKDLTNCEYKDYTADELFHSVMDAVEDAFLNRNIRMASVHVTQKMYDEKFIWIERRLFSQGVTIRIHG